jgi:transcriptional regulator of heat shock response
MPQSKVTDEMWNTLKAEYISSDITLRGLSKKYGIPFSQIQRKSQKGEWIKMKGDIGSRVNQKSVDLIAEFKAEECTRAFRIANKVMDKLAECVENIDPTDESAMKNLKSITSAIKDLKEIGVFRSTLDQAEQEARIKKLQKDAEEEQRDTTVNVVFNGDMEGYGD